MIVLDASAVLELVLRTPLGESVARRIAPSHETLHAPHLIDLEVAQVLRRLVASCGLDKEQARLALNDFLDLDICRYAHDMLLKRVWELGANIIAYDAAYVALAEVLKAPLITLDRRLGKGARHQAKIELLR